MYRAIRLLACACVILTLPANASNLEQIGDELEAITLLGNGPRPIPEFQFMDHRNQVLDKNRLKGHWNLLFFGYTHCPDVCPTTLIDIDRTYKAIKNDEIRESIGVYFVSVDPQRDSLEHLAQYMDYFNPAFTAATAQKDELQKLTAALGVAFRINKKTESQTDYLVSHSGYAVLVDPDARFVGLYFPAPDRADDAARDLERLAADEQS